MERFFLQGSDSVNTYSVIILFHITLRTQLTIIHPILIHLVNLQWKCLKQLMYKFFIQKAAECPTFTCETSKELIVGLNDGAKPLPQDASGLPLGLASNLRTLE